MKFHASEAMPNADTVLVRITVDAFSHYADEHILLYLPMGTFLLGTQEIQK
jgi:hypothetical protein